MSRKHYKMIADAILVAVLQSENDREVIRLRMVAGNIATAAKQDNPRFDRDKFMKACGV